MFSQTASSRSTFIEGENWIKDCIKVKYIADMDWELIYFEKQQTQKGFDYMPSTSFNTKFSSSKSSGIHRLINTNFPSQCLKPKETKEEEKSQAQEQYMQIELNCKDENSVFNVAKNIVGYKYESGGIVTTVSNLQGAKNILNGFCNNQPKCKNEGKCTLILDTKNKRIEAIQ